MNSPELSAPICALDKGHQISTSLSYFICTVLPTRNDVSYVESQKKGLEVAGHGRHVWRALASTGHFLEPSGVCGDRPLGCLTSPVTSSVLLVSSCSNVPSPDARDFKLGRQHHIKFQLFNLGDTIEAGKDKFFKKRKKKGPRRRDGAPSLFPETLGPSPHAPLPEAGARPTPRPRLHQGGRVQIPGAQ